jgi:hypothetical protein
MGGGSTYSLDLKAIGGDGGTSTGNLDGAGGGGGFVKVRTCDIVGTQTAFGGIDLFNTSQMQAPGANTIQGGLKGTGFVYAQNGQLGLLDNEFLHPMCDF